MPSCRCEFFGWRKKSGCEIGQTRLFDRCAVSESMDDGDWFQLSMNVRFLSFSILLGRFVIWLFLPFRRTDVPHDWSRSNQRLARPRVFEQPKIWRVVWVDQICDLVWLAKIRVGFNTHRERTGGFSPVVLLSNSYDLKLWIIQTYAYV